MDSASWKKWNDYECEYFRHLLRHIDSWLIEYRYVASYTGIAASVKFCDGAGIVWTGTMPSFTRVISNIISEQLQKQYGPYQHVIKVDLSPTTIGRCIRSIRDQLILSAAKELGLLDGEYNRLKEEHDLLQYYTYGCDDDSGFSVRHFRPLVGKELSTKKYLLVVDNLQLPIDPSSITQDCGLPLLSWMNSVWHISPASQNVYTESKSEDDTVISIERDEDVVHLIMFAMRQSAEHIAQHDPSRKGIEYWHDIALDCFHYAMAIFAKYSQVADVTSEELIHQWVVLLPSMTNTVSSSKCSYMRQIGRVILEAFEKYSLLQLPYFPADEPREATNTGAQFLAYHGLIAESITVDELFDNKKKLISFVGDHGCHVSQKWLLSHEEETRGGTTALILRGCLQQSLILSKLNHFLPKLCFLRVLDLSYTALKALPSSIGCLQILRLLSLRGCHDLNTLSSSSTTSSPLSTLYQLEILDLNGVPLSHLTQDMADQKRNLIHLDMSYSEITTFPPNCFRDMSNLEELILVNCSNLVELPPSVVALSSLTTLEITRTQIKYFPPKIFEEMKRLQSLKLIENRKLVSLPESISRAHGLINLQINGYESNTEEFKLEGHPTLISFIFIRAPHIRRLSLRECKKLESIEFKNLDALQELNLSGTAIKEVPPNICNSTQLKKLLLLGVPSLLRFPWHMLERLPEVFYLDQCTEGDGNHSDQVSQLCVSDPRFFYSFRKSCVDLVRAGRIFQSFYVRVAPCSTNNMGLQHEEGIIDNKLQELLKNQSTYVDVHSSCNAEEIRPTITVPLRCTERHVEITGMQQPPEGLSHLLNVTKSISVTCDTSISHFRIWSHFRDLEECELRWCHNMVSVFYSYIKDMENLRNVHVCNLKRLVWFSPKLGTRDCAFSSLEHLHLEYCPRLEGIVTNTVTLPSLKTLDVLFCYNLKRIFSVPEDNMLWFPSSQDDMHRLPSLQRIRLQELPLLQHFNDKDATVVAPMWKDLHVRGCWSLRHLPRLQDQSQVVKVSGERRWWSNLQWGSPSHRGSYESKLPPKLASFDKRTEVTTYLR